MKIKLLTLTIILFASLCFAQENISRALTDTDISNFIKLGSIMELDEEAQTAAIEREGLETEDNLYGIMKIMLNYMVLYDNISKEERDEMYDEMPNLRINAKERALIEKNKRAIGAVVEKIKTQLL